MLPPGIDFVLPNPGKEAPQFLDGQAKAKALSAGRQFFQNHIEVDVRIQEVEPVGVSQAVTQVHVARDAVGF